MRKIITLIISIISAYWIVKGFSYGMWVDRGPGGGMFPVIGGSITLIFMIVDFIQSKGKENLKLNSRFFYICISALATVGSMYLLGLTIACFIFQALWLIFAEKYKWIKSIVVSFVVTGSLYAIFKLWLAVPLYKGLLDIL